MIQLLINPMNKGFGFNKSFASNDKSKYWSKINNKDPRQVLKWSSQSYYFDCDKCSHKFCNTVAHISEGEWCGYCTNQKLCDDDECQTCFNKSFASSEKAVYWSDANIIKPRQAFKSSSKKYIFNCSDCNQEYIAVLSSITGGRWCGCIINKTETKLFEHLTSDYNIIFEKQKKFDWCKNKKCLPFDFYCEEYNVMIELDGPQHFKQVSNWKSPEETQKTDKYKMECANKNGYSVIRLLQEDVFNDKNNWKIKLKNAIKKYNKPTNIFIGDIYSKIKY
jgi:very-short-patch-repair endonuclease